MRTETITVIIPCFNEEEALPVYYQAMQPVMKQMENIDFELLFIDDGSTDHTLLEMKALHQKDPRCKYFSFSRNFGKEAAIYAGLSNAGGDYVAVMDVDLQDPPALLPQMYKILAEESMTAWQPDVLTGSESQSFVPFYPKPFTRSSIGSPRQKSCAVPEIFV